jgi:hypothetical protein
VDSALVRACDIMDSVEDRVHGFVLAPAFPPTFDDSSIVTKDLEIVTR